MKKILFFLFVVISILSFAQIDKMNPKEPLVKDSYFKKETNIPVTPGQKVEHKHSDTFNRKPDLYGGNPFFDGNVEFQHNGSTLTADRVVY